MLSHSGMSDSLQTMDYIACQPPLFQEFARQEYWSVLPFPPPGDLPDPGIESCLLRFLHWQADSLPLCHLGSPCLYIAHSLSDKDIKELLWFLTVVSNQVHPLSLYSNSSAFFVAPCTYYLCSCHPNA